MIVLNGLHNLPSLKNTVITIGTFDGVHLGHRSIIERLTQTAKRIQGHSVIITFEPHPRLVIEGKNVQVSLLTTLNEKLSIMHELPIDYVVVVPFTIAFAEQPAASYIQHFLIDHFHPHTIIIGYDHHFGKNRSGNYQMLDALKHDLNYVLEEIPAQEIEHITVSSTKIRDALRIGNMTIARDYLCRNYLLSGKIIHGDKRGRTIGFPTANIEVNDTNKLIPAMGVYAVYIWLEKIRHEGMMNIGVRPTIHFDSNISIEVHLFDFNTDIYDKEIVVEFVERLRNEIKFESIDALIIQLNLDKKNAISLFKKVPLSNKNN
jgi:riboflavin kinase / FMN adenylyltransferase